MSKKLTFNEEMQKGILNGVNQVVDAVASTLGPAGRTVMIQEAFGNVMITKDGVTVANSISLEDPVENTGAQLIKQIASKTNDISGDGTTTSSVLARELVVEGIKTISKGNRPIAIRNGINKAVKDVVDEITKKAKPISTKEEIKAIASISANDDTEIGEVISEAIESVGKDGVITVDNSNSIDTFISLIEGMQLDKGYLSPYFCTDLENMLVEYYNPYILLYDGVISRVEEIVRLLELVRDENRPLLIIAEDFEPEIIQMFSINNYNNIVKVCAVKTPGIGDNKKEIMKDIAAMTGATVVDRELGLDIRMVGIAELGTSEKVRVTLNTTLISGDGKHESQVQERIATIRGQISSTNSSYERERLQERLAKLAGGIAVIRVGAVTEAELKEKKHRIEDAINATRAALDKGIVPGGGATLAHIAKTLRTPKNCSPDEKIGYDIVIKSITKPFKQIIYNAGSSNLSGDVILDKIQSKPFNYGYDALNDRIVDMFKEGIIDPAKVTISALTNAASITSLILTSSCVVTEKEEKK